MDEDLLDTIIELTEERHEAGSPVRCLSLGASKDLAARFGVPTRAVNELALDNGIVPSRYLKNMGTVGPAGQALLLRSRVAVIGAGGIGGNAAELLARSGVGTMVLVDHDVFDDTNLNRQNSSSEGTVGLAKVDVLGRRLEDVNGDVEVVKHRELATRESIPRMIAGAQVVIDALDSLDDRRLLQEVCCAEDMVMIHGAIAGPFVQVTTVYPGDPDLVIVPPCAPGEKVRGVEVETGNPATTPALAAAIQAHEAVSFITKGTSFLRGRLLFIDLLDWSFELIEL